MSFEPMGGFPPIIIASEAKIEKETLEARGFPSINVVSIGNIMDTKKKGESFLAFGSEEEEGNILVGLLENTPYQYTKISDKKNMKKKPGKKNKKN